MANIEVKKDFSKYIQVFLEQNSKLNLISKNDEKFLFEKHIYDSLAIGLFFEKYGINKAEILDIGFGGGFPCVPVAIEYPDMQITGVDSIRKKVNAVNAVKDALNLENLNLICGRAENIKNKKFDIVTCRAVADMGKICTYALPLLKKGGYFIAYKSKRAVEELSLAKNVLNQFNAEVKDIISYALPLEEVYERCLVVMSLN